MVAESGSEPVLKEICMYHTVHEIGTCDVMRYNASMGAEWTVQSEVFKKLTSFSGRRNESVG